jgi:hypothetical protein
MTTAASESRIPALYELIDQQVTVGLTTGTVWGTLLSYSWGDQEVEVPTMLVVKSDPGDEWHGAGETVFIPWHAVTTLRRSRSGGGGS